MVNFDTDSIVAALVGGLLIALAATINLLCKGRITGISGIFYGVITYDESFIWKASLLSSMLLTSGTAYYIYGFSEIKPNIYIFDPPQTFSTAINTITLIFGGFLVGFGTKLGNGCTSGHGVCGIPRFSLRSLVAVITFMTTGFIMANLIYHNFPIDSKPLETHYNPDIAVAIFMSLSLIVLISCLIASRNNLQGIIDIIVSSITGIIFCLGLLTSGMSRRSKVISFLTFNKDWDISLMFVMGGAVMFNLLTFNYIIHSRKKPIFGDKLQIPTKKRVDVGLIFGAALFGFGWGLVGICPGPGIIVTPIYFSLMAQFLVSMATGQYLGAFVEKSLNLNQSSSSIGVRLNEYSASKVN